MKQLVKAPRIEKKNKVLVVRLTPSEDLAIKEYCKRHRIKKADLVRYLFNNSLPKQIII